jgi:hypothetical protein
MTLGWLSDIHLDHTERDTREAFLLELAGTPVDAWLISGDIDLAPSLVASLREVEAAVAKPVYFTLGNHDFYGGSFARVREEVAALAREPNRLTWLTDSPPRQLAPGLVLVGDDSWADARLGDPLGSWVDLNDFYLIDELWGLEGAARVRTLNALGDEAAARLEPKLRSAVQSAAHVLVLTHVPPFREATVYDGKISDDEWLPWFSCKAMGDVILSCAAANPNCEILVLCGHTHGAGSCTPAPNVRVLTAGAEYGAPRVQARIGVKDGHLTTAP